MAHTAGRSAAGLRDSPSKQTSSVLRDRNPRARIPVMRRSAQRREKVTLTVAEVSCWPGTTGVEESAAALAASR